MTEDDFLHFLQALLPEGPAWTRSPKANLTKILRAKAAMLLFTYERAQKIIQEANPRTTEEMLPDWEDICQLDGTGSTSERQSNLVSFLTEQNSQAINSYKKIAEQLGVEIEVLHHEPFRAGYSRCGGNCECGNEDIIFFWEVLILSAISDKAVETLIEIFNRKNQAHLVLTFIDKRNANEI